jgi:hypothetical protein
MYPPAPLIVNPEPDESDSAAVPFFSEITKLAAVTLASG